MEEFYEEIEVALNLTEDEHLLLKGYCQRYDTNIKELLMQAVRDAIKVKNEIK